LGHDIRRLAVKRPAASRSDDLLAAGDYIGRESHVPPEIKMQGPFMENIAVGFVAALLFVYLLVAVIRPEKF
jgi:K+-transporting ATPase KdpF subunit